MTPDPLAVTATFGTPSLRVVAPQITAPTTRLAVQRGVLNAVTRAVAPLGAKMFDHVPHGQAMPFVALDEHQSLDLGGSDIDGLAHTLFLSFWSDYRGRKQIEELLDAARVALHDQRLPLENGAHVLCRVTENGARVDADGVTYQGSLVAKIITNPF